MVTCDRRRPDDVNLVVVLVLFGKGKVSSLMGEVGKGITAFKKGVGDGTAEIEAQKAAEAAEAELPKGSADWIRAQDIAMVARAELEREKDRR